MTRDQEPAPLARCLAVWLGATATLAGLLVWLAPGLVVTATGRPPALAFDEALVRLCEGVLLACAAWLWVVTGVVVTDAAQGRSTGRRGIPGAVRRALLAACGVALTATVAVPAQAGVIQVGPAPSGGDRSGTASVVGGLPLPDRATAAGHVGRLLAAQVRVFRVQGSPGQAGHAERIVTVRSGDTLWGLATADLPPGAVDTEITRRWREIYRANRPVIGPDPDLIQPGQRLRLPRP